MRARARAQTALAYWRQQCTSGDTDAAVRSTQRACAPLPDVLIYLVVAQHPLHVRVAVAAEEAAAEAAAAAATAATAAAAGGGRRAVGGSAAAAAWYAVDLVAAKKKYVKITEGKKAQTVMSRRSHGIHPARDLYGAHARVHARSSRRRRADVRYGFWDTRGDRPSGCGRWENIRRNRVTPSSDNFLVPFVDAASGMRVSSVEFM